MTVSEQIVNVVIMTISGIFIGAVIDLLRTVLGKMSPKSLFHKIPNGIELFVWALMGVCTFIIIFNIKGGEWRLIDPLSQILGIYLYETIFQPLFRLIGRIIFILFINPFFLFIKLIGIVIRSIFKLLGSIILILLSPFIWFYAKFIRKYVHKTFTKTWKNIFKN